MDLDQLITKMEDDLASLRRARDLARQYGATPSSNGVTKKATRVHEHEPAAEAGADSWYTLLPGLLGEQSMSIKEVESALAQKGFKVAYSTIHSWMKRAVERGDYKRKSAKYRLQEPKDPHSP